MQRLDQALAPGQTGCLRAGAYGGLSTWSELSSNGNASGQITITAYPGEHPKLIGFIHLKGSYTTLSGLEIDGSNQLFTTERPGVNCAHPASQGLSIDGANDIFENNDLYQSIHGLRGNGLGIGWNGQADNTIVRGNKIHDVGSCKAFDHLIYLSHGNNVQIYDNWMWNDPHGWGVQLYPAPTNARVWNNVIDGAGSGFTVGDEAGATATGNQIWHNVVINSSGLSDAGLSHGVGISEYFGGIRGPGNTFSHNDSFQNPGGTAQVSVVTSTSNTTTDPQFHDAAHHNYTPQSTSPIANWGLPTANPS